MGEDFLKVGLFSEFVPVHLFLQASGTCYAVDPKMILPSFLVATSNAMGKATVIIMMI